MGFARVCRGNLVNCALHLNVNPILVNSLLETGIGRINKRLQAYPLYSTLEAISDDNDKDVGKMELAKNLASLVEESSYVDKKRPNSRMELKRLFEFRIKKRVKEQYLNGKFQHLMKNVISNTRTLQDAYNCIRLNSNVNLACDSDDFCFESIAKELSSGNFDVNANTFSISTRGGRKEVLILPNVKLKVVQEAIRIVLEIVYRPHFSKISHGCRSGRGHSSALRYICKEITSSDWWFTLLLNKKIDDRILAKLFSTMEDKIEDPSLYAVIQSMFDAQVLNLEFGGFPKGHGLPQEGVLSPILINIYLDLFDREFYQMSMRYEALSEASTINQHGSLPKLRSWFRRQLKGSSVESTSEDNSSLRVHSCRVMDEIFFAISGSKDDALKFKNEIENYLQHFLYLDVGTETDLLPCNGPDGIRFLGTLVRRNVEESPAVRAVHKLKDKVKLFASQKQEAWDAGTIRIGKKWLAYGLKKVKESEIKHLADSSSILSQISCFRKTGMETDHWYKLLMKIWMQDVKAKVAGSEEIILSKYIAEPALPKELRDSYYKFQKCAEEYIASETASVLALIPNSCSSTKSVRITKISAPVNVIKKCLLRYGLTNAAGYSHSSSVLILQDNDLIIYWFSGIVRRWLRWYSECDNFAEVKLIISNQVRKSCIRTLAAKFRMHENDIEKRFESELSRIPFTQEIEQEMTNGTLDSSAHDSDEALTYGISYSGLCLLSLTRMVSQSRPCNCFVMGCLALAPSVYTLHVMERQKFPGWKTGFSSCIHPSLNKRRIGLCKQHLKDLYLGDISLQSIEFGSWK